LKLAIKSQESGQVSGYEILEADENAPSRRGFLAAPGDGSSSSGQISVNRKAFLNTIPDIHSLLRLGKSPVRAPRLTLCAALLADTASQILTGALRGVAHFREVELELYEGEYDQIDLQILNPQSELNGAEPETVILYLSVEKFAAQYAVTPPLERAELGSAFLARVRELHEALSAKGCQTICFNLADPGDGIFGNYANKVPASLTYQVRVVNCELMRWAEAHADFHIYDLARLQADLGRSAVAEPKLYTSARMALTPDASRLVARDLISMMLAGKGGGVKCVILDLDNTLWGGVIGDDGLDRIQIGDLGLGMAFSRFQAWIKQLKDRGIVLAVCSKNEEANAREPFLKHPDMVLKLEDIAVFVANWKDKATNIRSIREIVEVDFSAMVFLDDNPAERALVRESFPSMSVPELPADPCEYVSFLQGLNLFETASYTAQDGQRTQSYQAEVQRRSEREKFVDEADFLRSLEMRASIQAFSRFQFPRIAQLTQRSNQFNLRTVRYTEKQIEALAEAADKRTFAVELRDRFGDYGLISVIILERREEVYFVDTWIMSCRVLGRGVESLVLNTIVAAARADGIGRIIGEYLPTAKNGMVKEHYPKLGFAVTGENLWFLDAASFSERTIQIKQNGTDHDSSS
jgi:FkbH-like protein